MALETIRRALKAHYLAVDADATLYDVLALEAVGEALDGINHALDYMEPRK